MKKSYLYDYCNKPNYVVLVEMQASQFSIKYCILICTEFEIHHSTISRFTVGSREAKKKKQHACECSGLRDNYSELFTQMAALKF